VGIALAAVVAGTGFSQRADWVPEVPGFDVAAASFELEPLDDLVVDPGVDRLVPAPPPAPRLADVYAAQERRAVVLARAEAARQRAEAQREREGARALRHSPLARTVRVQSTPRDPQKLDELSARFASFTLDATEIGLAAASEALRELSENGELAEMGLEVDLEAALADIDFDQIEAEATRGMLEEMRLSVRTGHGTGQACAGSACAPARSHADHLREMQERHAGHAAHLERQAAEMERKAAELRRRLGSR
jgi:hypothetical protein